MRPRPFPRKTGKPFYQASTTGERKWLLNYGSQHHRSVPYTVLNPYIKSVTYVLRWGRYTKDRDTLDLLRECESFLKSIPLVPQANVRGMTATQRAQQILGHVYQQGVKHRLRPQDAVLRILARAIA